MNFPKSVTALAFTLLMVAGPVAAQPDDQA